MSSPRSSPFPDTLRPILVYLQRANELDQKQPLIAYYCRSYAAQLGIGLLSQGKDEKSRMAAQTYLLSLMDRLEKDKIALSPDTEQGRAIVELFALKLFKNADDADRAGKFSKVIAKLFFTASILMEVTRQFGELSEDISEKYKYARWKAAEISKALKDGTLPQPGPFGGEMLQPQQNSSPEFDPTTTNTAGGDEYGDDDDVFMSNTSPPTTSTTMPPPQPPPSQQQQQQPPQQPQYQQYPPPQSSSQPSKQRPPSAHPPAQPPAKTTAPPPFPTSIPAPAPTPAPTPSFVPATSSSTKTTTTGQASKSTEPSIHDMMDAQKYAKYAVSALSFNDHRNARENLRKALELLGD